MVYPTVISQLQPAEVFWGLYEHAFLFDIIGPHNIVSTYFNTCGLIFRCVFQNRTLITYGFFLEMLIILHGSCLGHIAILYITSIRSLYEGV